MNSALHRARSTVSSRYHSRGLDNSALTGSLSTDVEECPLAGGSRVARGRLELYVKAWEEADAAGLAALLREDATFSMPPVPNWYLGRSSIAEALTSGIFAGKARRRWLLRPAGANRQPTFAVYQRQESGGYRLFGIQVLHLADGLIADVVTFIDPNLFRFFNLAEVSDWK